MAEQAPVDLGYRTPSDIHPCLTYDDAQAAIEWLQNAFGFTARLVVPGPDGTVRHSELSLGSGVVMVSSPKGSDKPARCALSVCVADADAHHAKAVAAGAKITQPLRDEDYGSRGYIAEDIGGHSWYFGTYRPGAWWGSVPER